MDKLATSLPPLSKWFSTAVSPLNRLFDRLYHSKYNPLYRSGTLAVAFLVALIVTGLYLSFFYSVSKPYASIEEIQRQVWLGRWMRAFHRYATDGAIVATLFHIMQLLAQGKTWGPRTLAWISGVILMGALFLSAWTGYVMVWDVHGQLLAVSGARMMQVFPFLRDILGVAFNGSAPVNPSFFFMNLFLHVAVPLIMFFGLWVHTARLARTVWFPEKNTFFWSIFAFVAVSVLWPAPLPEEADLLRIMGRMPVDIFTGFWIPLAWSAPPLSSLVFWTVLTLIISTIPWWWLPRKEQIPPVSKVDDTCSGCTQCVRDCPYEAITMIPRHDGKRLLAQVTEELCVSCGICAASCDDRAIGPPGRTAREQMEDAQKFAEQLACATAKEDVVVIVCERNGYLPIELQNVFSSERGFHLYPVECCGTVHSDVIETLLKKVGGVFLLGCPARNCVNRDGLVLISERVFHKRVPFLPRTIERRRLRIDSAGDGEKDLVLDHLKDFQEALKMERSPTLDKKFGSIVLRTLVSGGILAGIVWGSQVYVGTDATNGIFRVGARIPGRVSEQCRPVTDEEKKNLPAHMQRKEVCETVSLSYDMTITVDSEPVHRAVLKHSGARGDIPIFVDQEVALPPGRHELAVSLIPQEQAFAQSKQLNFQGIVTVEAGSIYLLQYDEGKEKLFMQEGTNKKTPGVSP